MTPTQPVRSVLIADNNEFYRRVLGDFYRELGFDVRTACHGMDALEQIQERRPDLVVLDLIMPCVDGAKLCTWLKGHEAYRDIPVIIFSGILCDEIDDLESIGADAYVAKMPMNRIATAMKEVTEALLSGTATMRPMLYGFEKMFRREVVLELLAERRAGLDILDSLTEGIAELTTDHRVLKTNRAFDSIATRPGEDLLSKPLEEVFPESGDALKEMFEALEGGSPVATAIVLHQGKDLQAKLHKVAADSGRNEKGSYRAIRAARASTDKVHLEEGTEPIGHTLLIEDVTHRVKTEKERESLKERLAQSEKMSALGVFVAGAAHELNNPLTSIMGYSQLLSKRLGPSEAQHELEKITAGAERCKTIIEQLMVFARSLRPQKKVTDINHLIMESVASHSQRFERHGIDVELDLAEGPMNSLVEAVQIEQVFGHILDNAIKALADTEGPKRLRVVSRCTGNRIRMEFLDTGPGIPTPRLSRVFDPFFTTEAAGQGRGLGLSVAYGIIAAHAGQISVRNRPEGGAAICMDLPSTTAKVTRRPDDNRPRRVLVVDDEPVVVELLAEIFRSCRHEVDTANGGIEALRYIGKTDYDLLVLDLRMPDMSGQQLYQELAREHPETLPRLLFITGDTVMPEIDGFLDKVGTPCLLKPFSIDMVVEKAEAILNPGRSV